jgi:integrase
MFRHTRTDGTREIVKVADYDPRGVRGMTLHEAREKAGELAKLGAGGTDLRELFAARAATRAAAAEAAVVAQRKAAGGTFEALFRVYVGTLRGRMSHDDAKSMFRLHVSVPFPELGAKPAAKVRAEELRDVLARLIDAGKGRTAAKLRAYVKAAFSMAMRASLDPTLPQALTAFDVESNPADRLPSLSQFSKALDRALTLPELKSFWTRLLESPECAARDALLTCLLLGGQRPAQLLRTTAKDVDSSGGTIALLDIKGRNRHANPRRHVLPIHSELAPIIQKRLGLVQDHDSPLFSSTGRIALRKETVSVLVREIGAQMAKSGELEHGPFSLRDLRRTAETHMAALGISKDIRAQIQSHGLGGIQARHYDRHEYMHEKREALELWVRQLGNE